jgi:hypothetical protein
MARSSPAPADHVGGYRPTLDIPGIPGIAALQTRFVRRASRLPTVSVVTYWCSTFPASQHRSIT